MKRNDLLRGFFILAFLGLCYFPLFLHLDQVPLRLWDEARRGVNALEMAESGDLLVTRYAGQPDMWGTKPPLLIWCQVFWMKILGYNELAVRLPAALAGLCTIFGLIFFSRKILNNTWTGIFAALVLLTTRGFISEHMTRSGDFDALLTLWETGYALAFFVFLEKRAQDTPPHPWKWLYLAALFAALAALTKGVAGFFFVPGLALYALTRKSGRALFLSRRLWLSVAGVMGVVAGFYLLRESQNPGYLRAVWENELGGRYFKPKEGHGHPFYLYFKLLYEGHFMPWLLWLPAGAVAGFFQNGRTRRLTTLIGMVSVVFFLVLMGGKTKIQWYMAPAFPLLALVAGMGFQVLFEGGWSLLSRKKPLGEPAKYLFLTAFTFALFFQPYQKTIERIYFEKLPEHDWKFMKYRDFMYQNKDIKNYSIVHRRPNANVRFYQSVLRLKGWNIRSFPLDNFDGKTFDFGEPPLDFVPGDTLMICEKKVFPKLDRVFRYEVIRAWDTCKLLVIK